jgi:hypothetical protein
MLCVGGGFPGPLVGAKQVGLCARILQLEQRYGRLNDTQTITFAVPVDRCSVLPGEYWAVISMQQGTAANIKHKRSPAVCYFMRCLTACGRSIRSPTSVPVYAPSNGI